MDDLDKQFEAHLDNSKSDDLDKEFEQHMESNGGPPPSNSIAEAYKAELTPNPEKLRQRAEEAAAFGRGALKFGTFGLSTEAVPAAEATAAYLRSPEAQAWKDAYRQKQAEYIAGNEAAYKAHPYAYGAGGIAGTLASGGLTAGLGAGLGLGGEGVTGAQLIANRAAAGGALGAISSAATSKANIDTTEGNKQLLRDTLLGGAIGAPLNVLGSAAVEKVQGALGTGARAAAEAAEESKLPAAGVIQKAIQNNPNIRQPMLAFKEGVAGNPLNQNTSTVQRITAQQSQDAGDVTNKILNARDTIGNLMGHLRDTAESNGATVDLGDQQEALTGLNDYLKQNPFLAKQNGLGLLVEHAANGNELTPNQAFTLRKGLINIAQDTQVPGLKQEVMNLQRGVAEKLNNAVPGLDKASDLFHDFSQAGPDTLLGNNLPDEYNNKYFSDITNAPTKLASKVQDILGDLTSPGVSGKENQGAFYKSMGKLRDLEAQHPGLMDSLGIGNLDEFQQDVLNKADKFALAKQTLGYNPQTTSVSSTLLGGIGSSAKAGVNKVANISGRIYGGINHSGLGQITQNVYNLPTNVLNDVATGLEQTVGANNPVVRVFKNAIANGDVAKRNSTLFSLLQNPNTREAITKMVGQGMPMQSPTNTNNQQ